MRMMSRFFMTLIFPALLALTGCGGGGGRGEDADAEEELDVTVEETDGDGAEDPPVEADGEDDARPDEADVETEDGMAAIHGTVSIMPDLFPTPPGDLAGPLYIGVLVDLGTAPAGLAVVDADFSTGPVAYEVADIEPGSYMVTALLDDNDNFSMTAPGPDGGDVWTPLTVPVELAAGQDLEVNLILDSPYPPAEPVCGEEPLDAAERQCIFDFIWTLADRYYPFFDLKGVDWDAVRADYEPLVSAAPTDRDFRLLMTRLLTELEDGHSQVEPMIWALDLGITGIAEGASLALVGGEVYVQRLEPGSAAGAAGLEVGDHVLAIDGVSFADLAGGIGTYLPRPNDPWYDAAVLRMWQTGDIADPASFAVERDGLTVEVARTIPLGDTPEVVSSRLTGSSGRQYGYIRIPTFEKDFPEVVDRFDEALDALLDVDGLILDVRENPGGEYTLSEPMIARLIDAPLHVENQYYRGSADLSVPAVIRPAADAYLGPIVVLVDEQSYSNGHIFPLSLVETGRATLVGRGTGGGNGTPESWVLTPMLSLSVATSFTLTASGSIADELGVEPDAAVPMTLADIQAGLYAGPGVPESDIVLRRAIETLGD
jgi:carboxyl-terminal processing protease